MKYLIILAALLSSSAQAATPWVEAAFGYTSATIKTVEGGTRSETTSIARSRAGIRFDNQLFIAVQHTSGTQRMDKGYTNAFEVGRRFQVGKFFAEPSVMLGMEQLDEGGNTYQWGDSVVFWGAVAGVEINDQGGFKWQATVQTAQYGDHGNTSLSFGLRKEF